MGYISYPEDRASTVTDFVVQYSTDSAFSADSTTEVVLDYTTGTVDSFRNAVNGSEVLFYNITDLTPGEMYYVQVCGVNEMGRGEFENATHVQFSYENITARAKADAIPYGSVQLTSIPAYDFVSVNESSTSLKVGFNAPEDMHGSDVAGYLVEWFDSDVTPEVKEITVTCASGSTMAGSFRLTYNGDKTDFLEHDASEDIVRTALEGLYDIRGVTVVRTDASLTDNSKVGYTW